MTCYILSRDCEHISFLFLLFLATDTSYREDNHHDIWQPMNSNNHHTPNSYQFQPIDQDYSSNKTSPQNSIQRPIPVLNKSSPYVLQGKRNSTINIDTTIRSYGLPRSMTSEHLANNTSNRLYHYPSVQDVLDALNRRSFDKESYV